MKESATEARKEVDPADDAKSEETSDDPDVAGNPPETTKPTPKPRDGEL